MENQNENFDQLRKLLALKKHEQPPPGYFNRLPGEVISQLRAGRRTSADPLARLGNEAPWLMNFWQKLLGKPAFAGAFGAAVCALLLGIIFFAEKPETPPLGGDSALAQPTSASGPSLAVGSGLPSDPVLAPDTNSTGPSVNLFEQLPLGGSGGSMPVSVQRNR